MESILKSKNTNKNLDHPWLKYELFIVFYMFGIYPARKIRKTVRLVVGLAALTCVSAEHSTYLTALSSLASFSPTSMVSGFCLFLASFSMVAASSRRSIWVPTSRKGVF